MGRITLQQTGLVVGGLILAALPAAAEEGWTTIFSPPSGEVVGRTLSQTVRIEGETIVVCAALENTSRRSIYTTIGFKYQVSTLFGSRVGERDVPNHGKGPGSVFPDSHVSSPMPDEDRSFFSMEPNVALTLCQGYDLNDFEFRTVRIQSVFHSWLRHGTLAAPIVLKTIGISERPLYTDEVLYSNTCDVDRRRKRVSCAKP